MAEETSPWQNCNGVYVLVEAEGRRYFTDEEAAMVAKHVRHLGTEDRPPALMSTAYQLVNLGGGEDFYVGVRGRSIVLPILVNGKRGRTGDLGKIFDPERNRVPAECC